LAKSKKGVERWWGEGGDIAEALSRAVQRVEARYSENDFQCTRLGLTWAHQGSLLRRYHRGMVNGANAAMAQAKEYEREKQGIGDIWSHSEQTMTMRHLLDVEMPLDLVALGISGNRI
jgi:hypothetical protein